MRWLALVVLVLFAACKKPSTAGASATLTFVRDGKTVATVTRADLVASSAPVTIEGFDPYYGKNKRFRAIDLKHVLAKGFGATEGFDKLEFVLRARDKYF